MLLLAVVLIVALLIPVVAILVDSPLGKSMARRMEGGGRAEGASTELRDMQRKVEMLETEVEDLTRTISGMKEELQFMQRLLEDPRRKKPTS
jgi:archaellum component FlaC